MPRIVVLCLNGYPQVMVLPSILEELGREYADVAVSADMLYIQANTIHELLAQIESQQATTVVAHKANAQLLEKLAKMADPPPVDLFLIDSRSSDGPVLKQIRFKHNPQED
jgi:hypothetical protein